MAAGATLNATQSMLCRYGGFYARDDYEEVTRRELSSHERVPVTYSVKTESKTSALAWRIFSTLVFPIAIYNYLHSLAGRIAILPSSSPELTGLPAHAPDGWRSGIPLDGEWKYKRITIEVDGSEIDAMIVGKPDTFDNGRWVLRSNGNGEFYEASARYDSDFKRLVSELNANAILFNYPGVGSSAGAPSRYAMKKAYRAMLTFLEDKEDGIGAKEIIGYGHSIGGGVQGDALKDRELQPDIKYAFVKSRTFSGLSDAASDLTHRVLGSLVWLLGWDMRSDDSSRALNAPEIILQTARVDGYVELEHSALIEDDGIITKEASLAKALLDGPHAFKKEKVILGMPEKHNDSLRDPAFIARKIDEVRLRA